MSWLFSRALVEEFLEGNCLDGEPSAQLNVMPTQHKFWRNDKTMECSKLSQFGLTLQVLTEDRGAELLMWFLGGFHAKTFPLPGAVTVLTERDQGYGNKWRGLLARFDPVTHSLKTAQCSLFEDLIECSAILPRWGSMLNGELYLRQIPALITSESESGLLPTPTATTARQGPNSCAGGSNKGKPMLNKAAMTWPTPVASMSKGSSPVALTRKNGKSRVKDRLDHAVMASNNGQLNPTWVEWLMGWPIGWTDLKPLEMDKYLEWQQQHLQNYQTEEKNCK